MLTRRAFLQLATGAAVGLCARRAGALGDREKFQIAQLVHGGNWRPRATALRRLHWEIDKRTSIDVKMEPAEVKPADPELHRYPFLYLAGDGAFPAPTEDEVGRLRRHLQAGGFLVADNAEGRPGGGFDRSVRALAERLFRSEPLQKLPDDHVLFKSFYLLKGAPGRVAVVPYL